MKLQSGDKVCIESTNDLLKAYGKAKTPFYIDSVAGEYVTLKFEDGSPLGVMIYSYEVVPYLAV